MYSLLVSAKWYSSLDSQEVWCETTSASPSVCREVSERKAWWVSRAHLLERNGERSGQPSVHHRLVERGQVGDSQEHQRPFQPTDVKLLNKLFRFWTDFTKTISTILSSSSPVHQCWQATLVGKWRKVWRWWEQSWQHHLCWRKWLDRTLGGWPSSDHGDLSRLDAIEGDASHMPTAPTSNGMVCIAWYGKVCQPAVLSTAIQWNFPECTSWECAPVICQHLEQARHQNCNKAATSAASSLSPQRHWETEQRQLFRFLVGLILGSTHF